MDMNKMTPDSIALLLDINIKSKEALQENQKILNTYKTQPSFCCYLLEISCNLTQKYPKEIELNAAIQLKNFIICKWRFGSNSEANKALIFDEDDEQIIIISEADKEYIRLNILDAVIYAIETDKVKVLKQLNQSIKKIHVFDFLKKWKDSYMNKIIACFSAGTEKKIYAGIVLLHQLSKFFEFEDQTNQDIYNAELAKVNSFLLTVLNECKDLTQGIQATFIYKILKIFFKGFQGSIPKCFAQEENFGLWSAHIERVIKTPYKDNYPSTSVFWKVKKLSFQIITRIHQKYGFKREMNDNSFQKALLEKYTPIYLNLLKTIYINQESHASYINDACLTFIYSFFSNLIINNNYNERVIEIFQDNKMKDQIIKDAIMPSEDLEMIVQDPKSYINKQIEEISICFTKRYNAHKVSNSILNYERKKKEMSKAFEHLFNYYINVLAMNEEGLAKENEIIKQQQLNGSVMMTHENLKHNLIKDSILYMIGLSHDVIILSAPHLIEEFFEKFVIKEFDSPLGLAREKACFLVKKYEDYKWKNENLIAILTTKICFLLQNDTFLPVKIYSAIATSSLLKQTSCKNLLKGNIKTLLSIYLKLIEETDIEEIIDGIQVVIKEFTEETSEFIVQLNEYLFNYFKKLTQKESDDEEAIETSSLIDNLIKTFVDIIHFFVNNEAIYPQLEKNIDAIVRYCLMDNQVFDKLDEALELIEEIVKKCHKLPKRLWDYYSMIINTVIGTEEDIKELNKEFANQIFEGCGFESLHTISKIICFMISKDPESFITGKDSTGQSFLIYTFNLIKTVLQLCENRSFYSEVTFVFDILKVLFDSFKGKIDFIHQEILKFIATKSDCKSKDYKKQLRGLFSACFLYNKTTCFKYYESTNQMEKVFKFWFEGIADIKELKIMKYHLIALSSLIAGNPAEQPPIIMNNMQNIIQLIMKVTINIPALKDKEDKENEEDEFEEIEDEDDGEGNNIANAFGGDDKDNIDLDEEISWNGDDDYDENFYITSVEKSNELMVLRDCLKSLSEINPNYYKSIERILGDQIGKLSEIFGNEEQRIKRKANK